MLCKLLWKYGAKNSVAQFQADQTGKTGEPHSGIGLGHRDAGLHNILEKLEALHTRSFGNATTDDASNWDLSTTRDGFVLGSMLAFQAAVAGAECDCVANFFHRVLIWV